MNGKDEVMEPTPKLIGGILFVQAGIPIILLAISLTSLLVFPIKGTYAKAMRAELAAVRAAAKESS